ncbi:hypothetical protein [Streptomyces lydicus]|uniref:hypothetical protein n=1 Tax=Streptomyces lydicus TaxID=47763 RepID=UPI003716B836
MMDVAFDLAADHSSSSEDQTAFLLAFGAGRSRAQHGCDVEADWLLLKAHPETSAALLAGFIEGLASTRSLAQWGGAR